MGFTHPASTTFPAVNIPTGTKSSILFTTPVIPNTVEGVENKVRHHVYTARLRLTDLFVDNDKLRSGYVTPTQFRRAIDAAYYRGLNPPLTDAECQLLVGRYGAPDHRVKWTDFVDNINQVFGPKRLENTPTLIARSFHDVVEPVKPILSPESESALHDLILRIKAFVAIHGHDVKSWFRDFDKHNNGLVTYNQFIRGLPEPLLSNEDAELLMLQYGEKLIGSVNYFKLNADVNRKTPKKFRGSMQQVDTQKHVLVEMPPIVKPILNTIPTMVETPSQRQSELPATTSVEEEIKKIVYKNRIRVLEFFRDYDHHNCGLITQAHFISGLAGACSLRLTQSQCQELIRRYQVADGRIQYRHFCSSINTIFIAEDLELNPLGQVPVVRLNQPSCESKLSAKELVRYDYLMKRLKNIVAQKRIYLPQFFKDFDRLMGRQWKVTASHFNRIMTLIGLEVSQDDISIIIKRFFDQETGKVDYVSFIKQIDMPAPSQQGDIVNIIADTNQPTVKLPALKPLNGWDVDSMKAKITAFVGRHFIRLEEYFKDFDKLRTRSITRPEFLRGLGALGCNFPPSAFETLADYYKDPVKPECCLWKKFAEEIDQAFLDTHLETKPAFHAKAVPVVPKLFMVGQEPLTNAEETMVQDIVQRIKDRATFRQVKIKPFFKDFDRLNTGCVTKSQLRQCLTFVGCPVTEMEFEALARKWKRVDADEKEDSKITSSDRFYYKAFLEESGCTLEEPEESLYAKTEAQRVQRHDRIPKTVDLNILLAKIEHKVVAERMRLLDLMQGYDHMNHGTITKSTFIRALRLPFPELSMEELYTLEQAYSHLADPKLAEYRRFLNDVETAFTVDYLESNPLATPSKPDARSLNIKAHHSVQLTPKENESLVRLLNRMGRKVQECRKNILPYLQDYDFTSEGSITTGQLRSVLSSLGLDMTDTELELIYKKFGADANAEEHPGGYRMDYRAFALQLAK